MAKKSGGWITINGTHVLIDGSGKIVGGPPRLTGGGKSGNSGSDAVTMKSKVSDVSEKVIIEAHEKAFGYTPYLGDLEFGYDPNATVEEWANDAFWGSEKAQFKKAFEEVTQKSSKSNKNSETLEKTLKKPKKSKTVDDVVTPKKVKNTGEVQDMVSKMSKGDIQAFDLSKAATYYGTDDIFHNCDIGSVIIDKTGTKWTKGENMWETVQEYTTHKFNMGVGHGQKVTGKHTLVQPYWYIKSQGIKTLVVKKK